MRRVTFGLVLMIAGMAVAVTTDAHEFAWPLNILVPTALWAPGFALIEPSLERHVSRWLGRTQ